MNSVWRVTIRLKNGDVEDFGCFESYSWACYHKALANTYYEGNKYNHPKYDDAEWNIEEVKA